MYELFMRVSVIPATNVISKQNQMILRDINKASMKAFGITVTSVRISQQHHLILSDILRVVMKAFGIIVINVIIKFPKKGI